MWYYVVLIVPDRIDGEKSHCKQVGFLLVAYFSIPVGCELGDVNWDPSRVKWDPYQHPTFYWDPGGIWWDSGEIWTGIPVVYVLGSRLDMVGYGLGFFI